MLDSDQASLRLLSPTVAVRERLAIVEGEDVVSAGRAAGGKL
jgi:hypothetical protein